MVDIGAVAGLAGGIIAGLGGKEPTTPEKLKIIICKLLPSNQLQEIKTITAPFNPTSYSITKPVNWVSPQPLNGQEETTERGLNAPRIQAAGGNSRTLTLDLFFDVTENPGIQDVRDQTNEFAQLAYIDPATQRQPICKLLWGDAIGDTINKASYPFIGVVTRLLQNFTLFKSNGKPVRAKLTLDFREFMIPEQDQRKTDPELTTRIVKLGDTLSGLAAEIYNDPTMWRAIAEANNLDDPRSLKPGQSLSIPEL